MEKIYIIPYSLNEKKLIDFIFLDVDDKLYQLEKSINYFNDLMDLFKGLIKPEKFELFENKLKYITDVLGNNIIYLDISKGLEISNKKNKKKVKDFLTEHDNDLVLNNETTLIHKLIIDNLKSVMPL